MGSLISVIIPNREGEAVIGPCLESLLAQTEPPGEIIVVDDASRDRSVEIIKNFQEVKLVSLEKSAGYAGASAEGLKQASGDWIAVLNNDIVADTGWTAELTGAARENPEAAMIASRVTLASPAGKVDSLGLGFSRGALCMLRGHLAPDRPDPGPPRFEPCPGPAGSAALYRRDLIEDVGFMEPDFFIYYEDADLMLRAKWRGYSCVLANRARVTHRHSFTVDAIKLPKRHLIQRNRLRTIVRNWPRSALIRNFPWIQAASIAGCVRAVIEGEPMAAVTSRIEHFRFLKKDLAFRAATLAAARISEEEMAAWLMAPGEVR